MVAVLKRGGSCKRVTFDRFSGGLFMGIFILRFFSALVLARSTEPDPVTAT